MTMPLAAWPVSATWWAPPSAQCRTVSKVYSSAIRARQPSVPKTMVVGAAGPLVVVRSASRFGTAVEHPPDHRDVRRRTAKHGQGLRGGHATPLQRRDDAHPAADPAHDEVVAVDLHGLAALHDGTLAACADGLEQRGPGPEIRPPDVHRSHRDLAVASRAFHDRMVDRLRLLDGLVGLFEQH